MKEDLRSRFKDIESKMNDLYDILNNEENYKKYYFSREFFLLIKNQFSEIFEIAKKEENKE